MHTPECTEHHEAHQLCTNHCHCCHGSPNRRKTWLFVFALIIIAIVASVIINQKKNIIQEEILFTGTPYLALFGDSRCEKCAPMFELFRGVEKTDSNRINFKIYDRKNGAFPYFISIEPTIILFDGKGAQLDSAYGVISSDKIRAMEAK